ncbi:pPIWI_RE module domain-containing protein [Pseudonocardia hydrocarbonoxydans]|uniref:pPIWI_RE module domain-containing protein n=1 Tax=Pseudonocardia hydrocarbonoxydans TaxID=76726 RepID=UPI0031E0EF59
MAPQYDALAITALRLATDVPLDRAYHVMRFPGRWKEILRQQARARNGREIVTIPIASLNAAITALVPDCVITMTSVGRGNDDQDWLLAHREINPTAIFAVVAAWIRAQKTKPEQTARTLNQLHPSELTWSPTLIDLGTAEQRARSMRLLPMEIAATLSRPDISCPHGELRFRRCPSQVGAELMSWPPLRIEDQLPHSIKIGITAQTLPTSDETYVYLSLGIRRWMPERGRLGNRRHSVYLAPTVPYLAGLENSRHFGTAKIKQGRVAGPDGATEFLPRWDDDLAGVLAEAGCLAKLPDPRQLTDKPLDFLQRDGDAAALVYSTGIGGALTTVHHMNPPSGAEMPQNGVRVPHTQDYPMTRG